jgi:S1-C subfamily serine protease
MNPSRRLSNVFFAFVGAAAVGLVIAVLAVSGVFDRTTERIVSQPGPATTTIVAPGKGGASVSDIYAKTAPGVAFIDAKSGGGGGSLLNPGSGQEASGSGFLIDGQGHVVTNDHVVEAGTTYTIRFGANSKSIPAKLLGKDPSTDLAVLEVDPSKIPGDAKPLSLASSKNLRPGDSAIAIGSPFGLSGTVTTGIVSALDREIQSPNGFPISGVLQTDAAINPGNSGGPLLDAAGRVIGVNSQIASSSRQSSGVGFAVPVDTVKQVVPQLISGGNIKRAYIGVSTTQDPSAAGAVVASVTATGPAAKTGLRPGDRITALDGKAIKTPSDLSGDVLQRKPGEHVKLTVESGGKQRTIDVQLGTRPDQLQQG